MFVVGALRVSSRFHGRDIYGRRLEGVVRGSSHGECVACGNSWGTDFGAARDSVEAHMMGQHGVQHGQWERDLTNMLWTTVGVACMLVAGIMMLLIAFD